MDQNQDEENKEQLEQVEASLSEFESRDTKLQTIRQELRDLITVDSRIRQCQ